MFIYNLKISKNILSKILFIFMLIIILFIFAFGIYVIFFKSKKEFTVSDSIKPQNIYEINNENYANILNVANKNIDSYIGLKVKITGYVYRLADFKENQFVIARDMLLPNSSQTLVIGFLCEYKKAMNYPDKTWVNIIGQIKKGKFNNSDIALLDIISIENAQKPANPYVSSPDNTYIPTANMF